MDKLEIKWLKDNKEISAKAQRMTTNFQDNSLTISGTIVRDSGTYTCIATNGLDQSEASAMLTVKGGSSFTSFVLTVSSRSNSTSPSLAPRDECGIISLLCSQSDKSGVTSVRGQMQYFHF